MRRALRWAAVAIILACVSAASAYVGLRTGRAFERNHLCCELPRWHNLAVSLEEALGLVRYPSQVGQDRWVAERIFPDVDDGFFVDVGSGDGYSDSNTWALERRGWSGICIDPFPDNMEERTCRLVRDPVSSVPGVRVTFAQAGDIGGIVDHLDRWKSDASRAPTVELTTTTLDEVLRLVPAPPHIHFMSVDVEGAELEALKGFPFDRHTLGALTIEHNYEEPKRTQIEALLRSHGYVRARTWMQDDFYLPAAQPAGSE